MLFQIFGCKKRYFAFVSVSLCLCFSFFQIVVGEQPAKQEWCPRYSAGKGIDLTWWGGEGGGGQPDLDGINIDF